MIGTFDAQKLGSSGYDNFWNNLKKSEIMITFPMVSRYTFHKRLCSYSTD